MAHLGRDYDTEKEENPSQKSGVSNLHLAYNPQDFCNMWRQDREANMFSFLYWQGDSGDKMSAWTLIFSSHITQTHLPISRFSYWWTF